LLGEGWRCNFFIAAEPTDMGICYEQKGGVWLELRVEGKAAHASRPWDGDNPLFALSAGLEALSRRFPLLASEGWRTTATPTRMHSAEGAPNQIPPYALLTLDIRHIAEDTPDSIVAAVQECFPTGRIIARRLVSPLVNSADDPAIKALAEVNARMRGQPTVVYREHFASDARFYSDAGIPAVCFGPVGHGLHADDEWVEIASLVQCYEVLRAYMEGL
ncbi:MAG: M20/M25/M40 family metallo-hydrolase, partial [Chloroflexaceae bacterium]|nr:M20/M25/M40 family metallo-hydrolase [Chloroflexaceae bacterium]